MQLYSYKNQYERVDYNLSVSDKKKESTGSVFLHVDSFIQNVISPGNFCLANHFFCG
jgi:hypothetical protein